MGTFLERKAKSNLGLTFTYVITMCVTTVLEQNSINENDCTCNIVEAGFVQEPREQL